MLRRPSSIKLMDVFGIRVGADGTWFVFLFLIILLLSSPFRNVLHSSDTVAYITTVVTVLLFFVSLVIHELGHAFAARRQGITVKSIQLYMFGGLTQLSRDSETPGEELKVAIAGPLGTLAFLLVCLVVDLAIVGPNRLWHSVRLEDTVRITPVLLSLSWLLAMNVIILVFNLVPAYPLDGGRIARALVWKRTGDQWRGTRAAARLGEGFAILLAGGGIGWLLAGDTFNGLWLIALAFMMGQSARAALVQTAVSEQIDGVRVVDIMDRHPVAIPAATPVAQALDEYFLRYGWSWFPVIDARGLFIGIALQERAQAATDSGQGGLGIASLVEPEERGAFGISETKRLSELLGSEALGRLGALMAVDGDGMLSGVITAEQIRRALQSAFTPSRTV
jgi:Zn-dependent protease/CBS domain-containing protein